MSEKRNLVKVTIVGDEYGIRSDASPEHTQAVAAYLDEAIRAVLTAHSRIESSKAAILAALQITDELFRERASRQALGEGIQALNIEVKQMLPSAKRGDGAEASSG
jgi:cell division protein ZapA